MGWVGEWDQIWTDSGSQRGLYKLTSLAPCLRTSSRLAQWPTLSSILTGVKRGLSLWMIRTEDTEFGWWKRNHSPERRFALLSSNILSYVWTTSARLKWYFPSLNERPMSKWLFFGCSVAIKRLKKKKNRTCQIATGLWATKRRIFSHYFTFSMELLARQEESCVAQSLFDKET